MISPFDRNNNSSNETKLPFNRFLNGGILHFNSSKLSPSRRKLSNGQIKRSHGSCREKIGPQPSMKTDDVILRKTIISTSPKDTGLFQKKKEVFKITASPPIIKLSDLNVKTIIPEESEEDLKAELEMDDRISRDLSDEKIIMRRKVTGRSKKVINSAPAGVYWPDLMTLVEMEEKFDQNVNTDSSWFGSGEQILIKNFDPDDSLLYENSENNYDIPNENVSEEEENNKIENIYENSKFFSLDQPRDLCSNVKKNASSLRPPYSEMKSKLGVPSVISAFTRVIPDSKSNSSIKSKEYFNIRQELYNQPKNDTNNNAKINEDFYDEAWDARLERKLGHISIIKSEEDESKTITADKFRPLVTQPKQETMYEPPWDSGEDSISAAIVMNSLNSPLMTSSSFQNKDYKQKQQQSEASSRQSEKGQTTNINLVVSPNKQSSIPFNEEIWYHPNMTRLQSEEVLANERDGTYLVRPSETSAKHFSLSVKFKNVFHMRICEDRHTGKYILGEYSKPYDSVQTMIDHFGQCMLPVKDAESVRLLYPFHFIK